MARVRSQTFTTIRTEGGLLPADILVRIASLDKAIPGLTNSDYHLMKGESFGNKIADSWSRLSSAWRHFAELRSALPEGDNGTTLTREKWLLPLFSELGYGRLSVSRAIDVDGKSFALSHVWSTVPIHLVGVNIPLDRRSAGVKGASGSSPHSLVQEFLNRSESHLWAFVSNGLSMRVLRDNASLTRQAYVEFDLEAMFSEDVYEDFVVLWMVCHQSRVESEDLVLSWLEKWTTVASQDGTRALDVLRTNVEQAITELGTGFVEHGHNGQLRESLRSGKLSGQDFYREILRLIYRLIFLFVAEDRNLLHSSSVGHIERTRYSKYYSLSRLRMLSGRRRGGPHPDLWRSLVEVFDGLGNDEGIPSLGLPALGSFLWSESACPNVQISNISNQHLLAAVRSLSFVEDGVERVLRPIDYRNLGSEELGAVYESLLEQHPVVNTDAGTFSLNTASGNERKTTGSYYTPTSLITELLDSALNPVLDETSGTPNPERAILNLKVIDPACGSGHFLIAAAHRIAKRLASIRTGDDEPAPDALRSALREVISSCIHGIDLNPMAVELCKVSLWMESMEPGKPLGFLDHRIIRGNGLMGATPKLLEAGVPDDAFKPLTGDDKAMVASWKKENKKHREGGVLTLFGSAGTGMPAPLTTDFAGVESISEDDFQAVRKKATRWFELVESDSFRDAVFAADTWCAAFVAPKNEGATRITDEEFRIARDNPVDTRPEVRAVVEYLASEHAFLHWHLAFPVVVANGGFDLVIGNPPWEKVKLSEKEFFASRASEIADMAGAKRKAVIKLLEVERPQLWHEYQFALRQADTESHFIRSSGRFPLCGRGDVNTYAVFAEAMRDAVAPTGRLGVIVPTGIATDDTTKYFFADLVDKKQLVSLFDFENALHLFPGIAVINRFCLLTLSGSGRPVNEADFIFYAQSPADLLDSERRFAISPDDIALMNPNTKTTPVFRSRRDAEITKAIYRRVPILVRDDDSEGNPWGVEFSTMFHMTNDSGLFMTGEELGREGASLSGNTWVKGEQKWLPLYEAKMAHQFNHRDGDYAKYTITEGKEVRTLEGGNDSELANPQYVVQPRYWVSQTDVVNSMKDVTQRWLLGFRDITNTTTNRRTMVSFALPICGVGHVSPLIWTKASRPLLSAVLSSFVLDYVARQKIGGSHMTYFVLRQLAVINPSQLELLAPWANESYGSWISSRILELTYTAWDLEGFANDIGHVGAPFRWNPNRREMLRAELDAAFFHLYEIERDEVGYIMDTFHIIKRKDETLHGEFRTKQLILERYDALALAIKNNSQYQTVLDPPPAHPSCAHLESTRPAWAKGV